jgi:AraC family transcriptional activator of pobA
MKHAGGADRTKRGSGSDDRTREIPVFSLYGEARERPGDDFVHIEDIATRSRRYGWRIDRHVHHGLCQILTLFSGGVDVRLDDVAGAREAPCVVIVPPSTVHAFHFTPGAVGQILTFAESRLASGAPERTALVEAVFARPAAIDLAGAEGTVERLRGLLDEIAREFREREPGWTMMLEWLVSSVLMTIARRHASALGEEAGSRPDAELFGRFRALVEKTCCERRPVGWYARTLGVTESRLDRAARAIAGGSAFETIQDRVILEARRKLIYIAAPVANIAYELGFEDPAYFWRFFRRRTGVTPAEFRRTARRRALGGPETA